MNTKIFEELEQAAAEVSVCAAGMNCFLKELEGVADYLRERSRKQKVENESRISALKDAAAKASASATFSRMSEIEIRQLEAVSYAPTDEEIRAFAEAKDRAVVAMRDYDGARERFRLLYDEALKVLTATKEEVFPAKELVGQRRDSISRTEEKFYLFVNSFNI